MGLPVNLSQEFKQFNCAECGIVFFVPSYFYQERVSIGSTWYCPNGHNRVFREPDVKKLERQLSEERLAREVAQNQAASARRALTRIKGRIARGVCPACNRTFQNLKRHMDTKHEGFREVTEIG